MTVFENRAAAGRGLAERLAQKAFDDPVILALPRGGVPVAIELVRALKVPMDLVLVRKIGAPGQPELALGAVVNGDEPRFVTNASVARAFGLTAADVETRALPELEEIKRRRIAYLGDRPQVPIAGRTAIVVDDGIATGATMRASLKAVRRRDPARVVLAVPVAPQEVLDSLNDAVDEIICLLTPASFRAVGAHYREFSQTTDAEVIELLDEAQRIGAEGEA